MVVGRQLAVDGRDECYHLGGASLDAQRIPVVRLHVVLSSAKVATGSCLVVADWVFRAFQSCRSSC